VNGQQTGEKTKGRIEFCGSAGCDSGVVGVCEWNDKTNLSSINTSTPHQHGGMRQRIGQRAAKELNVQWQRAWYGKW